jgi:hypothetical protein
MNPEIAERPDAVTPGPSNPDSSHPITTADLLYDEILPYVENLNRMARRAADDPGFYELAGVTVQRLADEISIQRIADEYYDGGDSA